MSREPSAWKFRKIGTRNWRVTLRKPNNPEMEVEPLVSMDPVPSEEGKKDDAMRMDSERMDWLHSVFEAGGVVEMKRYSVGVAGCQIFTFQTQHVCGYEVRGAIDAAMAAMKEKA